MIAVARSSLTTSLTRYSRSWGLWLLLVIAAVSARFWVPREDGTAIDIAINGQLPIMTSAMLGVSLGIVVSMFLLPIGYMYLRANTTRGQPWQVEEVTPASRVAIALGRFGADVAVLGAMLATLTVAGWFLAWLTIPFAELNLAHIAFALWLIAVPALMGLAALRILFDALPFLRGAFGDLIYFFVWIVSITVPIGSEGSAPGFWRNMTDFAGYTQPLSFTFPESVDIAIGSSPVRPGRIALDAMAGLWSPGYAASRFAWAGIAIAVAAFAGLIYRPHRPRLQRKTGGRLARLLSEGAPPPARADTPPAKPSALPILGLIAAEFRLIGSGRLFKLIAVVIAATGLFAEFRHVVSPAAMLLLIFGLTAQAGRTEASNLLALTSTAPLSPMMRRASCVTAAIAWSLLLALPAIVIQPSAFPLALSTGAFAGVTATALASLSRSAFAPRLVLLIAWYVYMST